MRLTAKFFILLLLISALGGMTAKAESLTLGLSPFTETSSVESNSIYELTIEQLKEDPRLKVLSGKDDQSEAEYTASVRLAKGPGGFVGSLKVSDLRAKQTKSMYVVLSEEDDPNSASSIARSITREIQACEAKRAEEEAESAAPVTESEEAAPEASGDTEPAVGE
jgi:hypothetical protein